MKITAIISEYNPFHNGHLFQLNKAKEETKPDITIGIMSGNFTQRGNMAVLPKDIRSKIAINEGFDIIIELPTIFAINNAETFSFGGINTLKNFPNTTLSFGSECGDINKLKEIANITKTEEYNTLVKKYIDEKLSYSVSSIKALNELTAEDFSGSNNILALEYIKQIEKLNQNIALHTVKRVDNYNNSLDISSFMSANGIRMLKNKELAKNYMPKSSYNEFISFSPNYNNLHSFILSKIFSISKEDLQEIFDVNEGIENRLKQAINETNSYESFIANVNTKRYSPSRINRILLNTLLDIKKSYMKFTEEVNYISVLAIKQDKLDMLGCLNNYTKVITKYADIKKLNTTEKKIYEIDRKANNLYSLINNIDVSSNMNIVK